MWQIMLNSPRDVHVPADQRGIAHAQVLSSIFSLLRLMQGCCSSMSPEICALVKNQYDVVLSFAKHNSVYNGNLRYVGNSYLNDTFGIELVGYRILFLPGKTAR